MGESLADRIDAVLPQTQCGRCGFDTCRPYAEAIAAGQAPINRCPPGGSATLSILASMLGRKPLALDPQCGAEGPLAVAWIDESQCIGCTLCIQACPVDAIVGAAKRMHTVVEPLCSGCERCVLPCPVDCIVMRVHEPPRIWTRSDADAARARLLARCARLERERQESERRLAGRADALADEEAPASPRLQRIGALVARAIARARQRRSGAGP